MAFNEFKKGLQEHVAILQRPFPAAITTQHGILVQEIYKPVRLELSGNIAL